MFEPVHGSAPDIAGRGVANPMGAILSGALMLRHLGLLAAASALEKAIEEVLLGGIRTRDIGGSATTSEFADEVVRKLKAVAPPG
jgi:isocitrate/isopropylmalate dehydrogenase